MKKGNEHKKITAPYLWGNLVISVFRLNQLFLGIGNEITKPAGQTSARWSVLASVYLQPQTVAQIGRRMGLSRQSVQRVADILSKENYTEFLENEEHKRSKLLSITRSGKQAMDKIILEQAKWAKRWSTQIDNSEVADALASLEKIEAMLRKEKSG